MVLSWQSNVSASDMLSRLVKIFLPRSKQLLISWLQSPSAVILEPKKIVCQFPLFPHLLFVMKWWNRMLWSLFFACWALSHLFHSLLSPSSRGILVSSSLSAIRVVFAYLRLLIYLPAILIPARALSSLAFLMMYFASKLNKQSDNTQPYGNPFPILN